VESFLLRRKKIVGL